MGPAIVGEFDAVVGDELVDLAVLVAFALSVADHYEELCDVSAEWRIREWLGGLTLGLPMLTIGSFQRLELYSTTQDVVDRVVRSM